VVGGIIALGLRELGISGKVNTKTSWIYRHYIILCRCLVNRILSCSVTGTVKNGVDCVPKGTVNHMSPMDSLDIAVIASSRVSLYTLPVSDSARWLMDIVLRSWEVIYRYSHLAHALRLPPHFQVDSFGGY
jgi:hypothetical protein